MPMRFPRPRTVVVDECHKVKSTTAKRTGVVLGMARAAERVRYLSGTPMPNRPIELWPVLSNIGALPDDMHWKRFARRFCAARDTPWGFDTSGASNLDELADMLAPVMFRVTKARVAPELPLKTYRLVEFDGRVSSRETKLLELSAENLLQPPNPIAFQAITDIRRMHAEVSLPRKVEYCRDLLDDGVRKLVVFAHHRDSVDALAEGLSDYGSLSVKGGSGPKVADEYVQRFQTDDRVRVIVANETLHEGPTLTAANHVVLTEPGWTPSEISQPADRCHRLGTTLPVTVDVCCVRGSIDAKMLKVVLDKLENVEQVVRETEETKEEVVERIAELFQELADEFKKLSGDGEVPDTSKETRKPSKPKDEPKDEPETKDEDESGADATLDDVRKRAAAMLTAKKRDELAAMLKKHGAKNISTLGEEHYGEFVREADEHLG